MTSYIASKWFWFVAGDETRAWSSEANAYVAVGEQAFLDFVEAGGIPTPIDTEENLWDVLRNANVPPRHSISTATLVARLTAAGLADDADTYMDSHRSLWRRFYTAGRLAADDVDLTAMLSAIGADAGTVLAPE